MDSGATAAECRSSFVFNRPGSFLDAAETRVAFLLLLLGFGLVLARPCAAGSGVFNSTGDLTTPRASHTATLLPNGKVLVEGGAAGGGAGAGAELYDPASGTWALTGSGAAPPSHTATLLPNGKVLVAGGGDFNGPSFETSSAAELYDPAHGTWAATGNLASPRAIHTATLLPNGRVLVAGGVTVDPRASAELYDPASGTWSATGSLATGRVSHRATLLSNGNVLVTGGQNGLGGGVLATAELYDPASGTWRTTGSLATARFAHTASLLPDGKVLVAGGYDSGTVFASAELYDPATETWSATGGLVTARIGHTATLLPDGKVLVAAGYDGTNVLTSAEVYNPASGTWSATGNLITRRSGHTATMLANGKVLTSGGVDGQGSLTRAELYVGPAARPTLLNIATRMRVLTGDQVLIGGFIITGTELKRVLIRGMRPLLNGNGVTLSDPTLELHRGNTTVASNDNWKMRLDGSSQQADIEATTIAPANDLESAILVTLSPGAYTAILAGKNGETGVGLVEVYDLGQGANCRLANISTRGFADAGDNVMIGGLIVGGGSSGSLTRVLVRALGPSVPVANALANPTLELHDGNGALIVSNDNWRSDQEGEILATGIPPSDDLEAAIVRDFAPGSYTTIVRGVNNATGLALVEAYGIN